MHLVLAGHLNVAGNSTTGHSPSILSGDPWNCSDSDRSLACLGTVISLLRLKVMQRLKAISTKIFRNFKGSEVSEDLSWDWP